jgi:pimeloyl-ACP methyl ester carboxylesterase
MRAMLAKTLVSLAMFIATSVCVADTCDPETFETRVSGVSQCLLMRRFGSTNPKEMVVWLHGDLSSGGPANYHFAAAETAARALGEEVLSVALVRPGYPDGSGDSSSVALSQTGRSDHYTRDNLTEVGTAIRRLRTRFNPQIVIVVGHSGGAATAAVLLGLEPKLIDGAVLVACPCDLQTWRAGRRSWTRSEDPLRWVSKIDPSTRVIALTGERDDNTSPSLARSYVDALQARNVNAVFRSLPNESHNSSFRSPEVLRAVQDIINAKRAGP